MLSSSSIASNLTVTKKPIRGKGNFAKKSSQKGLDVAFFYHFTFHYCHDTLKLIKKRKF